MAIKPICEASITSTPQNEGHYFFSIPTEMLLSIIGAEKSPFELVKNAWSFQRLCVQTHQLWHQEPLCSAINQAWRRFLQETDRDSIVLSNCELGYFPTWVDQFPELSFLCLNGNQISKLPKEYVLPEKLGFLDMSNNELTYLPGDFVISSRLYILDLSHNKISDIADRFFRQSSDFSSTDSPSLAVWLSHNRISHISNVQTFRLLNLGQLFIDHNPLFYFYGNVSELGKLDSKKKIKSFVSVVEGFNAQYESKFVKLIQGICSFKEYGMTFSSDAFRRRFDLLNKKDQELIYEMMGELSISTDKDPRNLTDEEMVSDMDLLCRALIKAIPTKFNRLSDAEKNAVFDWVFKLAAPITQDPKWGKHNAFDNVPRLLEAMACLEGEEQK